MPIAVTIKNWNDLKTHADRLANALWRLESNPGDPENHAEAIDACNAYFHFMGR